MKDLRKYINTCTDRDILSEDVMTNPDRDIISIVIDAYSNLSDTYLAAFSLEIVDPASQFMMEWKEYLNKNIRRNKDASLDEYDVDQKLLNTIDISNLDNAFYELRLKYIIKPDLINDDYKVSSVKNTIAKYKEATEGFHYKNNALVPELEKKLGFYMKNPYILKEYTPDMKEAECDLFVKTQSILIPIIDKTYKYKMDGFSFYGVWNDALGSHFTVDQKFSFVVVRKGSAHTYYMKIRDYMINKKTTPLLDIDLFGHAVNPFLFLTYDTVLDKKWTDIIPATGNEEFDKVLENTYKEAVRIEKAGEVPPYGVMNRIRRHETVFKEEFCDYIRDYSSQIDGELEPTNYKKKRAFIHLANLNSTIYDNINNSRKKLNPEKKYRPSEVVRRKNLSPMTIFTTIKQGYNASDEEPSRMFESNASSPSPIDILKMFKYIKISHHTATKKKPKSRAKNTGKNFNKQLVRISDLRYLGTFAPKNSSSMNDSLIIHFNLKGDEIVKRLDRYSEVFVSELD